MRAAVIDQNRRPLAPTSGVRARLLLKEGKAAVFRRAPLTIILKRVVEEVQVPDFRLKLDPGSRKTGVAIVNQRSGQVVFAAEIEHRGEGIKQALDAFFPRLNDLVVRLLCRTLPYISLQPNFPCRVL
jgi:hypothetical protein